MIETEEIQRRKPVWKAIAEFYLDTLLQDEDYDHITQKLTESSYSLDELKAIDAYEVFPVLHKNVLSVAGEWSGFNEDWLFEQCSIAYHRKDGLLQKWKLHFLHLFVGSFKTEHWLAIEERM